jgi:hypothetical protein
VVQQTDFAMSPLAAGGLAAGQYIAVGGDGIYHVTGVATTTPAAGLAQWLVSVDAKVDDLPTGFAMSSTGDGGSGYLGVLRFPAAPGICGRAAVTAAFASGILTITASVAQPWLRLDPATGLIMVDLYDSAMTSGTKIASVSLVRTSDTVWTAAMGSAPGITVAYLVSAGVDWTKNSSASQKTGVHLDWSFNQRQAQPAYTSPPTWYGGIGGCLGCTVTQFNYGGGTCPVMVGVVPRYGSGSGTPVESGPSGSEFFGFGGSVTFDDVFGAHWQGAVILTMVDPFYQQPYKPDCNNASAFEWAQDNGSGEADTDSVFYFPHAPLVEALANVPGGDSLPAGVSLTYDTSVNVIAPPYYPQGIPIGDTGGGYAAVETDWGFAGRACADIGASGRFASIYTTFVSC